jgi:hypothetical protein
LVSALGKEQLRRRWGAVRLAVFVIWSVLRPSLATSAAALVAAIKVNVSTAAAGGRRCRDDVVQIFLALSCL